MRIAYVLAGALALGVGIALLLASEEPESAGYLLRATLADPDVYDEGVYRTVINATAGSYELRFVPNGDSPRTLGVRVWGAQTTYEETFALNATRHGGDASAYYTWDYIGEKTVRIGADGMHNVEIDPHGDVYGPVSVLLES